MTETAAQAETLIALAAQRGLTLMVDHTFVYTPAIQKIKELITTGELGEVYYYDSVRVNLGLFQSDVNVIWELAVHDPAIQTGRAHVPPPVTNAHLVGRILLENKHTAT